MHLFEFEDQAWFPKLFRDFTTDFLRYAAQDQKQELRKKIASILGRGLKKSGTDHIIDMVSGGGGMLVGLNALVLKKHPNLKILLTDFYPNLEAFKISRKSASNLTIPDLDSIENQDSDLPKEIRYRNPLLNKLFISQ